MFQCLCFNVCIWYFYFHCNDGEIRRRFQRGLLTGRRETVFPLGLTQMLQHSADAAVHVRCARMPIHISAHFALADLHLPRVIKKSGTGTVCQWAARAPLIHRLRTAKNKSAATKRGDSPPVFRGAQRPARSAQRVPSLVSSYILSVLFGACMRWDGFLNVSQFVFVLHTFHSSYVFVRIRAT